MQSIIDICAVFKPLYDVLFNGNKSYVGLVGKTLLNVNPVLVLGDIVLP